MKKHRLIVVKIGTNVLTSDKGLLNTRVMVSIVEQVSELKRLGNRVIVVSSGAMGAARGIIGGLDNLPTVAKRQVLASVGQIRLLSEYSRLFGGHGFHCAQVLATKSDFRDRQHYLNMKNCFDALLMDNIVPIANENDVVSIEALMFTDNDELAGLVASMMDADTLIMLTNVDGVYSKHPDEPGAKIITEVNPKTHNLASYVFPVKSHFGRGGMHTKCRMGTKLARLGITTHIANGSRENVLLDIVSQKPIGTRFKAEKRVSAVKKWIAHAHGHAKGSVVINACAEEVLCIEAKASSLLPVGISEVEGDFTKGDIVCVRSESGQKLGLGIARYDSKRTRELMGKNGGRPLIHYDYLFLD